MAGEHTGRTRSAEVMTHFPQLAGHGGILQVWRKIFEPEQGFYGQSVEVLKDRQRGGRHLIDALPLVLPGEAPGNRPFEQRHAFLRRHGLKQRQHPLFFHRLDDDQGVAGANQCAEIVHARRE